MLLVDVNTRPDIYQVYHFVCFLRNTPYPLRNSPSAINFSLLAGRVQQVPLSDGPFKIIAKIGSQFDLSNMSIAQKGTSFETATGSMVNLAPMRRGRPQKGTSFETATASMVDLAQSSVDLGGVIPNATSSTAGVANTSSAFDTDDPFSNLTANPITSPHIIPHNTRFLNYQPMMHTQLPTQQQQVDNNLNQSFYPRPAFPPQLGFQQSNFQQSAFQQQQQPYVSGMHPPPSAAQNSFAPQKPPKRRSPAG